jgi:MraZ protein
VFKGTHQHSIDAKGRTSLPVRFRETLVGRSEELLVVTQGPERSLWCLPPSIWAELEKKVAAMPMLDQGVRALVHAIIAPAQECSFDKMGRILVPPTLRAYAGLESEVYWLGAINRIELWSGEKWRKRHEVATATILDAGAFPEELAAKLGNLGL